jgi:hypothetical protein
LRNGRRVDFRTPSLNNKATHRSASPNENIDHPIQPEQGKTSKANTKQPPYLCYSPPISITIHTPIPTKQLRPKPARKPLTAPIALFPILDPLLPQIILAPRTPEDIRVPRADDLLILALANPVDVCAGGVSAEGVGAEPEVVAAAVLGCFARGEGGGGCGVGGGVVGGEDGEDGGWVFVVGCCCGWGDVDGGGEGEEGC